MEADSGTPGSPNPTDALLLFRVERDGGVRRFIATGVRWAESSRRKNSRGIYETAQRRKNNRIILNNDNDESRALFETCQLKAKRVVNPIIDWTDRDVWEFIESEHIEVNPLYCEGFDRVGCIGCPMAAKKRYKEFKRWPKYKELYLRAFARMLERRKQAGKFPPDDPTGWKTPEEVFSWWMEEKPILEGQISMEEIMEDEE